ncbi:hypothetical protein N9L68_03345 [bacterium]|nr:hypothetical protein [bacterium]
MLDASRAHGWQVTVRDLVGCSEEASPAWVRVLFLPLARGRAWAPPPATGA